MAELEHPFKPAIEALRQAILASDVEISEQVKWNAPSFVCRGVDRVTFRLHPGRIFQVILHSGVSRQASAGAPFQDASGQVEWVAADRGVISFRDPEDARARLTETVQLITRWMRH